MGHALFWVPLNQSWGQRTRYSCLFFLGEVTQEAGVRGKGVRQKRKERANVMKCHWNHCCGQQGFKPPGSLSGTWDVSQRHSSGGGQLGHLTGCHFPALRAPLRAVPGASPPPHFSALLDFTLTRFL